MDIPTWLGQTQFLLVHSETIEVSTRKSFNKLSPRLSGFRCSRASGVVWRLDLLQPIAVGVQYNLFEIGDSDSPKGL